MTKERMLYWLQRLGAPVLTVVLGLILVISPDTASSLIVRILGCVLALSGGICAAVGALGHPRTRPVWLISGVVLVLGGLWLLRNPLVLAKFIGRVLGLLLMIQGGRDINVNLKYSGGQFQPGPGMVMAIATAAIGLILLVLPLTTSRLLFMVIGVVLICLGGGEIFERLKGRKGLGSGDDPNIIDVEKL